MAFSDVVLLKPPVPKKESSDVVLLGSFSFTESIRMYYSQLISMFYFNYLLLKWKPLYRTSELNLVAQLHLSTASQF